MYLIICSLLCMIPEPVPQGESMDAAQFLRVIKGLQSKFEDQTFVFEGEHRFIGPKHLLNNPKDNPGVNFQGLYAQRFDNSAGLLDLFQTPLEADQAISRTITVVLDGKGSRLSQHAKDNNAQVRELSNGTLSALSGPLSAHFFNYISFFQIADENYYAGREFQVLGTHRIDRRPCLLVQYGSPSVVVKPERIAMDFKRLYIDLERDGHPVRLEQFFDGKLVSRTDMRLGEVEFANGGRGWFPMGGEVKYYNWEGTISSSPFFVSRAAVVPSSLVINSGLQDDVFSIDQDRQGRYSNELKETYRKFRETKPRVIRTDYPSVQAELDQKLAEADRQSRQIDASAAASRPRGLLVYLQAGFGLLGLGLIALVVYLRWGGR
ncbi:hypothetical protein BH23PLA1_BH23PLA1_21860 [soil metagenome]